MSEQNTPRIDEMYNRKFMLLMLVMLILLAVCAVAIGNVWHNLDATLHTVVLIAFAMSGVTSLVLLLRLAFCRVRINESGADVDNPFSGNTTLAWGDIRTAAIVRITMGGKKADPVILLSTREPEIVLTHRALTTSKVITKDEHVRIPLTPARRKAVEHYLGMTLPEYTL